MKILMLVTGNSLQDGVNRHVLAVAPAVNDVADCEVAVCTISEPGAFTDALEKAGVRTFALGCPHGHDLRLLPRFGRVMRTFRPDVVHAHNYALALRLSMSLFHRRTPVVATCHGITDLDSGVRSKVTLRDRLDALVGRLLPGQSCGTIFISRGVRQFYGDTTSPVIYNPMRFAAEAAARPRPTALHAELGLAAGVPLVGTACRVSPPKKPLAFTAVLCDVLRAVPSAHAVVCGTSADARLMQTLRDRVAAAGVTERFHWLGYRPDAPRVTAELDCFVMTSATEGLPTALLEAMSVCTPVAFLRGKGGLIDLDELNAREGPFAAVADADDLGGLARQVVDLLGDAAKARAFAARAFDVGSRAFSLEAARDALVAAYRRTLRRDMV